jgi:arylsulfatase
MSSGDRPNVLVFLTDQQRFDWTGTGSAVPVRTPALDALAERGAAFENAVCPSPLCGPSRACLATGMEYDRCGVPHHDFVTRTDRPTLYARLREEAGYHVLGVGKFDLQKSPETWGVDGKQVLDEYGFSDGVNNAGKWDAVGSATDWDPQDPEYTGAADPYMAFLEAEGLAETHVEDMRRRGAADAPATFPTPLPEAAYCDNWIARQGLDLLADAPEDRPWHLVVNFAGPHSPFDVTEAMHEWYRDPDVTFPTPVESDEFDAETHQEVRRNYAAMVENVDRWLGEYLDVLVEREEREDTLVVFTSDHGEMLGDHGQWGKRTPYQPSVGVPLVVDGPGVTARRVAAPTTTLDLHATILDDAGLDVGDVDSRSLWPVLTGERDPDDHREAVYSGVGPWRMVFDGRHKLVAGYDRDRANAEQVDAFDETTDTREPGMADTDPLLFDLSADPGETTDLARERPDVVADLRARLRAVRT